MKTKKRPGAPMPARETSIMPRTLCQRCADQLRTGGKLLWPATPETVRICDGCRRKAPCRNFEVRDRLIDLRTGIKTTKIK